ncbi:MAG: fibrobacter succinogenes major paralogous domain-containing protein [Sediminibacterium sp.]
MVYRMILVVAIGALTYNVCFTRTESIKGFKIINEVIIGAQIWSTKNWDADHFANGDAIPQARTKAEWKTAYDNKTPVWCYYDNDTAKGRIFGKLYNWYAVSDPRGLAPKSWRVPSEKDFITMAQYLKVETKKMKSETDWENPGSSIWDGEDLSGDNSSGFNAKPGGYVFTSVFLFTNCYEEGHWWTSDAATDYKGNPVFVIKGKEPRPYIIKEDPRAGKSVRLIKNVLVR